MSITQWSCSEGVWGRQSGQQNARTLATADEGSDILLDPEEFSLVLDPVEATIASDETASFSVQLLDASSTVTEDVTNAVEWLPEATGVINLKLGEPSTVIGANAGTAKLNVTYQGLTTSATITVTDSSSDPEPTPTVSSNGTYAIREVDTITIPGYEVHIGFNWDKMIVVGQYAFIAGWGSSKVFRVNLSTKSTSSLAASNPADIAALNGKVFIAQAWSGVSSFTQNPFAPVTSSAAPIADTVATDPVNNRVILGMEDNPSTYRVFPENLANSTAYAYTPKRGTWALGYIGSQMLMGYQRDTAGVVQFNSVTGAFGTAWDTGDTLALPLQALQLSSDRVVLSFWQYGYPLVVLNSSTLALVKKIALPSGSNQVFVSAFSGKIVAMNIMKERLSVIDPTTGSELSGKALHGGSIGSYNGKFYILDSQAGLIRVVTID